MDRHDRMDRQDAKDRQDPKDRMDPKDRQAPKDSRDGKDSRERGDQVHMTANPDLEHAVLIGAFSGWNDAASAASWALKFLVNQWDAQPFADLDPELFYDFTAARPTVRINGGSIRRVSWPTNRFYAYRAERENDRPASGQRDIILLLGDEPHLRWKTFTKEILAVCRECHVEEIILLGSLVAEVPHTAPVQVSGTTTQSAILRRLVPNGVERASYNGVTGILTVLQEAARKAGFPATSLWGVAPHYVSATPNLPVSEALLRKLDGLYDFGLQLRDLSRAAERFNSRVSSLVADDPDVAAYVRELEQRSGSLINPFESSSFAGDASGVHLIPREGELPSPEQAVESVEELLRRYREESGRE
jgi:proteasome assembly chaperone (PAC2) family protein